MSYNKRWTDEENNILRKTVEDALKLGSNIKTAYRLAAKKINRTEDACRWRWNYVLKAQSQSQTKQVKDEKVTYLHQKPKKAEENKTSISDAAKGFTNVLDVIDQLFGFSNQAQFTNKDLKSSEKNNDISNLNMFPMHGSNYDFIVIDEVTKVAYLVCAITSSEYFCSCNPNPFSTSKCRHVAKVRKEKKQ